MATSKAAVAAAGAAAVGVVALVAVAIASERKTATTAKAKKAAPPPHPAASPNIPTHTVHVAAAKKPAPKVAAKVAPKPVAHAAAAVAPKPAPKPNYSPRQAAEALYSYAAAAVRSGQMNTLLGTKQHPNARVKELQGFMKRIDDDGDYGDQTMARGKELLGKPFPQRVAKPTPAAANTKPATLAPEPAKPAQPKPAPPAPKPAPKAPAPKKKPAAATPAQAPASTSADAVAADDLDRYLMAGGTDRERIANDQWAMGLDTDGLPGTDTHDKTASLLARPLAWPADIESAVEAAGAVAPGGSSPQEAADRLVRYYRDFAGRRTDRIEAYQKAMGVSPAGVVGPLTRTQVLQLTGVEL